MKKALLLISCFALNTQLWAQDSNSFAGYVYDESSGKSISGAIIKKSNSEESIKTDANGYFYSSTPNSSFTLTIEKDGYNVYSEEITFQESITRDYYLTSKTNINSNEQLDEIIITTNQKKLNIRKPEMSVNTLTAAEIKKMPVVLGETDVLKSILLLPGVVNSGEGTSGFNVRGGGSDQNLIQFDDATVYGSSHLYGFFSIFNADVIRDLKLYKGGIPARFGGRASSVLEISQRNGDAEKFKANGGIGLLSSRLLFEGPIVKDKLSYIIGGRSSYAHLFLKLTDLESAAYFYDLNAKINYTLNDNNNFFLSSYYGRDVFRFKESFDNSFGNTIVNFRWNHIYNSKLYSNTSLVYSDYFYGLTLGFVGFDWDSGIQNFTLKHDFSHNASDKINLKYGFGAIYYDFNPGKISPIDENSAINYSQIPHKFAFEPSIYLEAEHQFSETVTVNYGLRYSMFYRLGSELINNYQNNEAVVYDSETQTYSEGKAVSQTFYGKNKVIENFGNIEPRIAVSVVLDDNRSIKASFNRMTQYVHLISNTNSATPLDIWAPSGNLIKPQIVDQGAVGYFQNISDNKYSLEIESYLKLGQNRLDYIDGANLIGNQNIEQVLLNGKTRAHGIEFLFRKNTGKFTGFVAYTFSKAEQQTKGRNENEIGINYGEWYRSPFDRAHDLSVVGSYDLNKKWSFNANFTLQSGRPVTYPSGHYEYMGQNVPMYDYRNNYSLPSFHHLDISATYTPKIDENKKWQSEWVFGIYNVYNRKNAASISFRENEDFQGKTEAAKLSIFGIVPSVTYNFKF